MIYIHKAKAITRCRWQLLGEKQVFTGASDRRKWESGNQIGQSGEDDKQEQEEMVKEEKNNLASRAGWDSNRREKHSQAVTSVRSPTPGPRTGTGP